MISRSILIIRINTTDSHFLRSVQFYDTFKNCLGYSFDVGVRRGSFFAKSGIRMIFEKEGETSSCNIGKSDNSFIESKDISSGLKDIYYTGSIGWIF
nr:omptin family outer membrane protease [Treponema sp.]